MCSFILEARGRPRAESPHNMHKQKIKELMPLQKHPAIAVTEQEKIESINLWIMKY